MTSFSRRRFLSGAATAGLAACYPELVMASAPSTIALHAAVGSVPLAGDQYPPTQVWAYNGSVPGPEIRVKQGERVRVVVDNALPQPTTVHWHGLRIPNAMDGVPGLTQAPIAPGQRYVYEFAPPDAGTFWYHSHFRSSEQVGRGLLGALIVEEPDPLPVHRDLVWVLDDWRLNRSAAISGSFGHRHDASHGGRIGNVVTVNGRIAESFEVHAGERIRLRLINAANARGFGLRFDGHAPKIIAIDGQPVTPHAPDNGIVLLGPAMRVDLLLECNGEPGAGSDVVDAFYRSQNYRLVRLSYAAGGRAPPLDTSRDALGDVNTLSEPDVQRAERHDLPLGGGAMGGLRGARFNGRWLDMRGLMQQGVFWVIGENARRSGDYRIPLIKAARGSSHILTLYNQTAFPHPMHLHGHHFRVLSRNRQTTRYQPWQDTVLVLPRERVDIAFNADNPGRWLFHCHVLEHHAAGMGAVIDVA